jgi:capsular exopolysaccharide synthesis family protein
MKIAIGRHVDGTGPLVSSSLVVLPWPRHGAQTFTVRHLEPVTNGTSFHVREYLSVLLFRKWYVIGVTALVVVGAMAYSYLQTPMFSSQAKVLVEAVSLSATQPASEPNIETEKQLVDSATLAALVTRNLHLSTTPEDILKGLSVGAPANTEVLLITYQDPDPLEAQRRAQAFAEGYLELRLQRFEQDLSALTGPLDRRIRNLNDELQAIITQISQTTDPHEKAVLTNKATALATQVGLLQQRRSDLIPSGALSVGQIEDPADRPTSPVNRSYLLMGGLALFLGLAFGVGVALVRDRLDDHLRAEDDFEASSGAAVFAAIPHVSRKTLRKGPLLVSSDTKSPVAEAYRVLRAAVLFAMGQRPRKVLVVTSPESGDGKTTVVANLGASIAQTGKSVILVSADLQRRHLDEVFGITDEPGLSEVLRGELTIQDVLRPTHIANLSLIPAGRASEGVELLASEFTEKVLDRIRNDALVVVDVPPILGVADSVALSAVVGSVLLVVNAKRSTTGAIDLARRRLEVVGVTIMGGVLNNYASSDFLPHYWGGPSDFPPYYRSGEVRSQAD